MVDTESIESHEVPDPTRRQPPAARRKRSKQQSEQHFMAIKVPAGHGPGDKFNVRTPDGQWMQVECPPGVSAGQDLTMAYEPTPAAKAEASQKRQEQKQQQSA